MMRKNIVWILIFFTNFTFGQNKKFNNHIETSDIKNFWNAYDDIKKLNDSTEKINHFQNVYINKGTVGLRDFIKAKDFTAESWIQSFRFKPKFWESIRRKTENLEKDFQNIEKICQRFGTLYKDFKPPRIYFTIGNLKSGGVVINGNLIIGTELAASDASVDFSELPKAYQDRMKINSGITFLTIHELVHTQQKLDDSKKINLLGLCLKEGSADFITELLMKKNIEAPYIEFGLKNQCLLWSEFEKEMHGYNFQKWLFNTATVKNRAADLGYFMGYIITKNYYEKSKNKKLAVEEILNLDFSDEVMAEIFLKKSGYICK